MYFEESPYRDGGFDFNESIQPSKQDQPDEPDAEQLDQPHVQDDGKRAKQSEPFEGTDIKSLIRQHLRSTLKKHRQDVADEIKRYQPLVMKQILDQIVGLIGRTDVDDLRSCCTPAVEIVRTWYTDKSGKTKSLEHPWESTLTIRVTLYGNVPEHVESINCKDFEGISPHALACILRDNSISFTESNTSHRISSLPSHDKSARYTTTFAFRFDIGNPHDYL